MKLFRLLAIPAALFLANQLNAQEYKLDWSDEFENEISRYWTYDNGDACDKPAGCGWGNKERQWYQPDNATVEDGVLKITAKFDGKYTSTRMKTQGLKAWKYGRVEARIKIPAYKGSFPAFWMLGSNITEVGWPACGEIDIMEHVNVEDLTHGNVHYKSDTSDYSNNGASSKEFDYTKWHIYSVDITPEKIVWYIDNEPFHEQNIKDGIHGTDEFHEAKFIILNHAVGGHWPGWDIDFEKLPAALEIDYVRVYQIDDLPCSVEME